MTEKLEPVPTGRTRKTLAKRVRDKATALSDERLSIARQKNNGEADDALRGGDGGRVAAHGTFTKGLDHDEYGRVRRGDLRRLISEINQDGNGTDDNETPFPGTYKGPVAGKAARFAAPLKEEGDFIREPLGVRRWESPISGHVFDLQGGDADQTAMPPAPAIGTGNTGAELTAEMAEVYAAALLRDVPFSRWDGDAKVDAVVSYLEQLPFFKGAATLDAAGEKRRAARFVDGPEKLDHANLLRGSTSGAQVGPYVSQFMLVGNPERPDTDPTFGAPAAVAPSQDALVRAAKHVPPTMRAFTASTAGTPRTTGAAPAGPATEAEGFIRYGLQTISQRFVPHEERIDHMCEWGVWRDVQDGANRKAQDQYLDHARFVTTPRDLASYVHFDQLYQAYLNACLLLLEQGWPTDQGLPEGPGHPTRDGFATFGGPHVLTLVTEVATRALKAVRRQKYNVHLRSRPEALAGAIALARSNDHHDRNHLGSQKEALEAMAAALHDTDLLKAVAARNADVNAYWAGHGWAIDLPPNGTETTNALLPMAFPEGSPMHPAYGAGHATVAGACVTVLKAFFEMYDIDQKRDSFSIYDIIDRDTGYDAAMPAHLFGAARSLIGADDDQFDDAYQADPATGGRTLEVVNLGETVLTAQGELDKLAANISIGRNFAGVHFYTDYYESVRMGERIAVTMLQEQMLTYREPVSMRFTSFDDDRIMLIGTGGSVGNNDTPVLVWDKNGSGGRRVDFERWLTSHAG